MKKVLCLLLATIMLTSLCGCLGGNDGEDVRGEIVGGNNSQNTEQATQQTEAEPEFELGKTASNTYINDFLGISCSLSSEWAFYTDEQILELNNIVGDYYDEDIAESLKEADIIYDMYAVNQVDNSNINVNLEKLSVEQIIGLNIKQTLEAQFDAIESSYQNMGYTDIQIKYELIEVDGKEFDGLKLTAKIQGVDFYATVITFRKSNYLANITVCSIQTDSTDAILNSFTVE